MRRQQALTWPTTTTLDARATATATPATAPTPALHPAGRAPLGDPGPGAARPGEHEMCDCGCRCGWVEERERRVRGWREEEEGERERRGEKNNPPLVRHTQTTPMPRSPALLCLCLAAVLAQAACLDASSLARWLRGGGGGGGKALLSFPPPPPSARYALLSTAAPPACAAACALVLVAGGANGDRVLASTTPLRPRLVAVVEGGDSGSTVRTAVRCPAASRCWPLGPAAAGLALPFGEGPGTHVVLDGLPTLNVHQEGKAAAAAVGVAVSTGRGGGRQKSNSTSDVHVRASYLFSTSTSAHSPPDAAALFTLSLTALAALAAVNGLAVGFAIAAARRGAN